MIRIAHSILQSLIVANDFAGRQQTVYYVSRGNVVRYNNTRVTGLVIYMVPIGRSISMTALGLDTGLA